MNGYIRKKMTKAGPKWYVTLEESRDAVGKRRQISCGGYATEREAKKVLREKLTETDKGVFVEPNRITVAELMEEWLKDVEVRSRPTTYENYRYIAKHVVAGLGPIPLKKLHVTAINDLYRTLIREYSESLVNRAHIILSQALDQAVLWEWLSRNPAKGATKPKKPKVERQPLTDGQIRQFMASTRNHPLHIAFLLAVVTGMRKGEILGLRWEDIDEEHRVIRVQRQLTGSGQHKQMSAPKTERSRRAIAVGDEVITALKSHRLAQADQKSARGDRWVESGLVVTTSRGTPVDPRNLLTQFKKQMVVAQLPETTTLHDLRHSHATMLLKNNVNPKIVSERLGHSTITITLDTYSHVLPTMQAEVARITDTLLS